MSEINIRGAQSLKERDQVRDLIYRSFYRQYPDGRRDMEHFLDNLPDFPLHHNRMLFVDNRLAACLTLYSYTVRLGEARLSMGGVAHVATDPACQKAGHAARLMANTMDYMEEEKFQISCLFGIADFYHRWGYTSVFPEHTITMTIEEALAGSEAGGRERHLKPADLNAVQRLHLHNDTDTAGSIIRFSQHYNSQWPKWENGRVLLDDRGKVVAYHQGNINGHEYQILEADLIDASWSAPLLHACALYARNAGATRLCFHLPPSHLLANFFLLFQSEHTMRVPRNCHGMMTIIHLSDTLKAMKAEWQHGMKHQLPPDFSSEVTLIIDKEPWLIQSDHGDLEISQKAGKNKLNLTLQEFTHLLVGFRSWNMIVPTGQSAMSPSTQSLLSVLFPRRSPYIWAMDRF